MSMIRIILDGCKQYFSLNTFFNVLEIYLRFETPKCAHEEIMPLYFLIHLYGTKKNLELKFSKWWFWWIYTFWDSPNSEITFLTVGLYVCIGVSACVCLISITQKQIITETSNFVFYIYILCWCYIKLFMKARQVDCTQERTK